MRYVAKPVYVQQEDGTGAGVIFGVLIAGIFALGVGAYFLLNQRPVTQAPSKTTIIERTKEVPTSQPKAPDVNVQVPQPKAPDVNVQVPQPKAPDVNVQVAPQRLLRRLLLLPPKDLRQHRQIQTHNNLQRLKQPQRILKWIICSFRVSAKTSKVSVSTQFMDSSSWLKPPRFA